MLSKSWKILRMLLDPAIRRAPLHLMRELRKRGVRRLPPELDRELAHGGGLRTFQLLRRYLRSENPTRHQGRWVLNSFLPPFPSAAYDRMFEAMLSGRRLSPVSAFLAVTAECPYHCRHCSAKLRPTGTLPTELWKSAIDQLVELGAALIGFTGGEPMCRRELPELIAFAHDRGAETLLFTTGIHLDDARAEELRQAGLWGLAVSLDHTDPARFNAFRGREDAYELAIRALRVSRRHGFYTMSCCVATPEVMATGEYRKIHALSAELGVDELRIVEPMPCGKLRSAAESALLTPEAIRELRDFHVEINRRSRRPKVCAFNQIESPELFGCGGGTMHLYIDSAGQVCPCDFTPLSFGNLAAEPLAAIWERMTTALGEPRRECFLRSHADLIEHYADATGEYPLAPETSCALCREVGYGTLPDYFRLTTGRVSTLPRPDSSGNIQGEDSP